jgi:hypothetical protein
MYGMGFKRLGAHHAVRQRGVGTALGSEGFAECIGPDEHPRADGVVDVPGDVGVGVVCNLVPRHGHVDERGEGGAEVQHLVECAW